MRFVLTYIRLKLKELFRSPLYLGFFGFMLLLALCMALLFPHVSETSPFTLAVLNEHSTLLGQQVTAALEQDGGYLLRICKDRRELEARVLSGEALCGYAFREKADARIQSGRYTNLVDSFYREKSPAAALCDEAVCGAVFSAIAPLAANRYLEQTKLLDATTQQQLLNSYAATMAKGSLMNITLLGMGDENKTGDTGSIITRFLYSIYCSLVGIFAIIAAFYTHSIDKSLVFAGQKPALVGLCSLLAYSVSYLVILTAVHLVTVSLMPGLLTDVRFLWSIPVTAAVGGMLQAFARRFLSPAILPVLPFAPVLLLAVTLL
ncbi:MAG: hypothetical protein RSD74_05195 [Angelakisella sp.]